MVRVRDKVAHKLRIHTYGRLWWSVVVVVVLWQLVGCVIPPPAQKEPENSPPAIDWDRCEPASVEVHFSSAMGDAIIFSLEEAVTDPDGDELHYLWYFVPEQENPVQLHWSGPLGEFTPCGYTAVKVSAYVVVVAVVSDGELTWQGDTNPDDPVKVEEGHAAVKRVWVVVVAGQC